jgi:hypothetical protein
MAMLALFFLTTGCFHVSADELYRLPKASEEYLKLQIKIDAVLNAGAEYSPPTGGPNRQSVQLKDIDGDGVDEAVAFFRIPGDLPLKIYIFQKTADDYEVTDIIEGGGTAIESIRYIDMDGDGVLDIAAGWQMSSTLQHMTLYSMIGLRHTKVAEADYSALTVFELTGEGNLDVCALRMPTAESRGEFELFSLMSDGEVNSSVAYLTAGVELISRVLTGSLSDGTPAVYVEGRYAVSGVLTDIFVCDAGNAKNIAPKKIVEDRPFTARTITVYSSDINGDGVIDVPRPVLLPAQSETNYYLLEWYNYSADGSSGIALRTYHNYNDGWFFIIPEDREQNLSLRREDVTPGERAVVFSYVDGDSGGGEPGFIDFLRISVISGENKEERSALPGRFTLYTKSDSIYTAEILPEASPTVTEDLIRTNFSIILSDWVTGAVY